MSNDRHLDNNTGTMGNLFRRMTMASLGLDAMNDVSQQSFDVIDRADTFVQRLLGGVDRMMPTNDFERIGVATSSDALWNELYSGIISSDGPKNATDVGEWQYWLDAVLLMLFDEDEEEVSGSASKKAASSTTKAATAANVQAARAEAARKKQQIRERVAQLNASGVKPSMLRQLSSAKQREIAKAVGISENLTKLIAQADSIATSNVEDVSVLANTIKENALLNASNADVTRLANSIKENVAIATNSANANSMINEFATALINASVNAKANKFDTLRMSSEQVLASHVVERARRLEAETKAAVSPETAKLLTSWKENMDRFSRASHRDGSDLVALHEMQRLVGEMSAKGIIQEAAAKQFKESSRTFAARSLDNVLSKDFAGSLILNRLEQGIQSIAATQNDMLISARAIKNENTIGMVASKADVAEKKLSASFENFNSAIKSFVENADESASTMRWARASERFDQMRGMSDEQDRVLLRDLIESATQLESNGIIPKGTVANLVNNASANASRELGMANHVEMLQSVINDTARISAAHIARTDKLGRQFNSVMHNVNGSIDALVTSLKQAGVAQNVIDPLVRDITQLKVDDSVSLEEGVNRVELLSHALDNFVERALNTLPEQGYDMMVLEAEKSFVAPESANVESANAQVAASGKLASTAKPAAQLNEVRKYVAQVQQLQKEAEAKFAQLLSDNAVDAASHAEIVRAMESHNVEAMVKAQQVVAAKLNATVNAQIAEASQRMEETRAKFEAVSRQVSQIERAADLASMLHLTSNQFNAYDAISSNMFRIANSQFSANAVVSANAKRAMAEAALATNNSSLRSVNGITLGDVRIDKAYMPVLNETINAYTKLRDEYAKFDNSTINSSKIEEATQRLERMTTLIQPAENKLASVEHTANTSRMGYDVLNQQVGYDEIVPESMNKLQKSVIDRGYASVDSVSNYASMLGARKALEMHANSLVQGNASAADADAFRTALGEVMASKSFAAAKAGSEAYENSLANSSVDAYDSFDNDVEMSYVNNSAKTNGEVINNASGVDASVLSNAVAKAHAISKFNTVANVEPVSMVTVNEQGERLKVTMAQSANAADGMVLRQSIGESYQPAALRRQDNRAFTPAIDIKKLDQAQSISGAERFVPVMLGTQTAMVNANISKLNASDSKFEAYDADTYAGEQHFLNVSVAGTDVSMTPDAYVQAVAQPQISQAARSLSLGSDALYESFASVLAQQGAGRSLSTLRRAFFEKLSQAGRTTARGWIGLNSQSFASLLGVESGNVGSMTSANAPASINATAFDAEKGEVVKSAAATSASEAFEATSNAFAAREFTDQASESIRSFVASETSRVSSSSASGSQATYATGNYGMQFINASANAKASAQVSGELLGHIDSLLDYVEDVSSRNVGVFSTNDVVRVLVEQLPKESYLGERGLPNWRLKDVRAHQIEEARELREALRKIGASPIQGTQRFNDKKYVSPNLMPNPEQAAPLFSGGVDSGSTPSGSASASGYNSSALNQGGIPDADIQVLVDECYERFMESLNEELQRRRSE